MSGRQQLDAGLKTLGLKLPEPSIERLLSYVYLLGKWNRTYNLTAIREPSKVVSHHILDSLAVLPYIDAASMADIGSGAGLPGIPLAIARPEMQVAVVESNHKKSAFLRQATLELRLENIEVVLQRAEKWEPKVSFDLVISRAFADLAGFVEVAAHLCGPNGVLVAMKGLYPDEELGELPPHIHAKKVERIEVPGLRAARHLVIMQCGRTTV
jgi:16S rRNA (guanine527-N7)-methyltransferase